MAAKSTSQRILEVVAVLLVGAAAVFVGVMVWNNQRVKPDALQQKREAESKALAAQQAAGPARPKPGDELRLNLAGVTKIEAAPWPSSARLRHLCTDCSSLKMSRDGRWAVATQNVSAGQRLAVWNLEEGKLLRYLSAELNKPTPPYSSQDDADFGAKINQVNLVSLEISPSGRRCAAAFNTHGVAGVSMIYAWDLASGKMICRYEEPGALGRLFVMVDDDHVVVSCRDMIVRLNVNNGEADLLRGVDSHASLGASSQDSFVAGTVHNDTLALAGTYGIATISLEEKEYATFPFEKEIDISGETLADLGENAMAFIRYQSERGNFSGVSFFDQGQQIIAWRPGGGLDSWSLATGKQNPIKRGDGSSQVDAALLAAAEAGLLAQTRKENGRIALLDMQTGDVASSLQVPLASGTVQGISAKADRLALQTDQFTTLLVDFPGGIPKGTFDLAEVLQKTKLPATR